jgi:Secretion system C-terminal sorting domain
MKRLTLTALTILLSFLAPQQSRSQFLQTINDSLVDVFPLSVGNRWTYRYFFFWQNWPGGNPGETRTDSGSATYHISGRASSQDSTRWECKVSRDLIRHQTLEWGGIYQDTVYSILDTSYFDLIESHLGQHQIYRNADPYKVRADVFPFTREFVDSTLIYRFRQVNVGDTVTFQSWIDTFQGPYFRSVFTFKKDVGLTRNSYNSGTIDFVEWNEHILLDATITSVHQATGSSPPSRFSLYQNYPNPFNPSTVIRYTLPQRSAVELSVFNTLGQQVAMLVNGEVEAGYHEVHFDASRRSSGVYFYRLTAGNFVQTRKLLLLR